MGGMPTYQAAHEFAMPMPLHTLTPEAEDARIAVRRHGYERHIQRVMASIVTNVGRPRALAPFEGSVVTDNALRLEKVARAAGFTVRLHELARACMVEGHRAVTLEDGSRSWVGFRAMWIVKVLKGEEAMGAGGATWHEPWRYEMVDDARAVKMDATARTALKGYRTRGQGTRRLSIVASPVGTPIAHAALREHVAGYADA